MRDDDGDQVVDEPQQPGTAGQRERADSPAHDAPPRRFRDTDGTEWLVRWHPGPRRRHGAAGTYVFRTVATGEEHSVPAVYASGQMLERMPLPDVRQLLSIARSGLVGDD